MTIRAKLQTKLHDKLSTKLIDAYKDMKYSIGGVESPTFKGVVGSYDANEVDGDRRKVTDTKFTIFQNQFPSGEPSTDGKIIYNSKEYFIQHVGQDAANVQWTLSGRSI